MNIKLIRHLGGGVEREREQKMIRYLSFCPWEDIDIYKCQTLLGKINTSMDLNELGKLL